MPDDFYRCAHCRTNSVSPADNASRRQLCNRCHQNKKVRARYPLPPRTDSRFLIDARARCTDDEIDALAALAAAGKPVVPDRRARA